MRTTRLCCLAAAIVLASCKPDVRHSSYRGDGQFVDRGRRAAAERYVVDFGAIDLATLNSREFAMSSLPAVEFTFGLDVRSPSEPAAALFETQPLRATVRLEVLDQQGQAVISAEAPLTNWTWSGNMGVKSRSFVYLRGDHGGAESSFTARSGDRYTVKLAVVEPDPRAAGYTVTARVVGGGWKAEPAAGS